MQHLQNLVTLPTYRFVSFQQVMFKISILTNSTALGGVSMTPGRLSPRTELTPVPSHGSLFVYLIPQQNAMPARVTPA